MNKELLTALCYVIVATTCTCLTYPAYLKVVTAGGGAKFYENKILGLSLQYGHNWTIDSYDKSDCLKFDNCYIILIVTPQENTSVISIRVQNLSSVNLFACICRTLHDYVAWNYGWNDDYKKVTILNDNQTTLSMNHSAWQAEISKNHETSKSLVVFAINDNLGYIFDYSSKDVKTYNENLSDFKGVLKSTKFSESG